MSDSKLEVYTDEKGEWRWRLQSANGQILADSGEGYANKDDCVKMAKRIFGDPYDISVQEAKPDGAA